MYKCVDAKGVTHYSDKPKPDCKGVAVNIKAQPSVSGAPAPASGDVGAQEREFQRRQIERGKAEEAEARRQSEDKRRCAGLRAELDLLTRYQRVSRTDSKGERVYLDDAAREARSAQLKAEIGQHCRG